MDEIYQKIAEKWPSEIVFRSKVSAFSGGILHPRTCANWDANRSWQVQKYKIGNRVGYLKADLIKILREKTKMEPHQ